MKIRVEVTEGLSEDEVIIRCGRVDDTVRKIHDFVQEQSVKNNRLVFYKDNREFYFPLDTVLFFETDGDHVFAHTENDAYRIKYRLYALEELLPRCFVRASKSAIVNSARIYSISRNLTASSLVQFTDSHKQIYVSRRFYPELRRRMDERSRYET